MAYTKQTWQDLPSKTTPINASRLGHIEQGIYDAASTADTAASNASSAISGLADKVDKVEGKGLSTNDFTDALQTKLNNIAEGAEVNVQSDWSQSNNSADDYIKNKPSLGTASAKNSTSVVTDSTDLVESGAVYDVVGWGNKNKLAGFELGNINRTTGQEEASTSIARSINYIPVTAGEEYTISGSITVNLRVFTFNSSKTYINSDDTISISGGTGHYTIPSGVSFVRFIGTASGIGSDMQFELGSTATAYEPYHESVVEQISKKININVGRLSTLDAITELVPNVYDNALMQVSTPVTSLLTNGEISATSRITVHRTSADAVDWYGQIGSAYYGCGRIALVNNVWGYKSHHISSEKADNSVIGTVEGANASKAWSVGEHFISGGQFKEVTQPISSGGAISNSNTVDKPIADCLVKQATFSGTTSASGNILLNNTGNRIILAAYDDSFHIITPYKASVTNTNGHVTTYSGEIVTSTAVSGTYYYI